MKRNKRKEFGMGWVIGSSCAALLGIVITLVHRPAQPSQPLSPNPLPLAFRFLLRFVAYINQPLFLAIVALAATILVIRRRFQGLESLIASLLIGGIVAQLIKVWISH